MMVGLLLSNSGVYRHRGPLARSMAPFEATHCRYMWGFSRPPEVPAFKPETIGVSGRG